MTTIKEDVWRLRLLVDKAMTDDTLADCNNLVFKMLVDLHCALEAYLDAESTYQNKQKKQETIK